MAKGSTGSARKSMFSDFGWALLPFVFLVSFWVLLREVRPTNPTLLPSPLAVSKVFWANLTEGELLANIRMSVQRVLIGLVLGIVAAVPFAFFWLVSAGAAHRRPAGELLPIAAAHRADPADHRVLRHRRAGQGRHRCSTRLSSRA